MPDWPVTHEPLLWYQLLIALMAVGAVVIATTGIFMVMLEMRALRQHINSRMDQLLKVAEAAAYARGQQAGPDTLDERITP